MRWLFGDVRNWSEHFTWSANLSLIRRESRGRETPNVFDIQELSVDYCCFLFKYGLLLMICQFHAFSLQQDTLVTQKIIIQKKLILKKIPVECRLMFTTTKWYFHVDFFPLFCPKTSFRWQTMLLNAAFSLCGLLQYCKKDPNEGAQQCNNAASRRCLQTNQRTLTNKHTISINVS